MYRAKRQNSFERKQWYNDTQAWIRHIVSHSNYPDFSHLQFVEFWSAVASESSHWSPSAYLSAVGGFHCILVMQPESHGLSLQAINGKLQVWDLLELFVRVVQ